MISVIADPATCKVLPHANRAIAVGGLTRCARCSMAKHAREST
jgi:hypothetical protein